MAKKKQFVTAAAAFAVAASAVAPAITADAATQTVRLKSDFVRVGNLDATLDKEYKGSEIYWYKSSVDMNKLGVFQTAKGFVKGKGIRVEKRVRVLNHAQEIKPASEFVFEQGVPVSGIRIQPVLFADGVEYNKPLFVAGFSTEKVGEFEGTLTYSNKAYGTVTKKVKYKVVDKKADLGAVKEVSAINNTSFEVAVTFENEVKASDLSGKTISLKSGDGSVTATATFKSADGKVATFVVNEADRAKLVNGAYSVSSSIADFAGKSSSYSAVITGNYVEGFVYDDATTPAPVAGATVKVGDATVMTNDRGYYKIATNPGLKVVEISKGDSYFVSSEEQPVKRNYSTVNNVDLKSVNVKTLRVAGTVLNDKDSMGVAGAQVQLQAKDANNQWVDVKGFLATTDAQGKFAFGNELSTITSSASAIEIAGQNPLSIGKEYRTVIKKGASATNLDSVFKTKEQTFTVNNKQVETSFLTRVTEVKEIESMKLDLTWADEAVGTAAAKIEFLAPDGKTVLEEIASASFAKTNATDKKLSEAYDLVKAPGFANATAASDVDAPVASALNKVNPKLESGTYFLRIADGTNAITIVPVTVTEGQDVSVSAQIQKAQSVQMNTLINNVTYGQSLLDNPSTPASATFTAAEYLGDGAGADLTQINPDSTRSAAKVDVMYNVYQTVAGKKVLVKSTSASDVRATQEAGITSISGIKLATAGLAVNNLAATTYTIEATSPYVSGTKSFEKTLTDSAVQAETLTVKSAAKVESMALTGDAVGKTNLSVKNIKLIDKSGKVVAETGAYTAAAATDVLNDVAADVFGGVPAGEYKVEVNIDGYKQATSTLFKVLDFQNAAAPAVSLEEIKAPMITGYIRFADNGQNVAVAGGSNDASVIAYDSKGDAVVGVDLADGSTTYSIATALKDGETYKFVVRGNGFETQAITRTVKNGENLPLNFDVVRGGKGMFKYTIVDSNNNNLGGLDIETTTTASTDLVITDSNYDKVTTNTPVTSVTFDGKGYLESADGKTFTSAATLSKDSYKLAIAQSTNALAFSTSLVVNEMNGTEYGIIKVPAKTSKLNMKVSVKLIGSTVASTAGDVDYIEIVDENGNVIDSARKTSGLADPATVVLSAPANAKYEVRAYFKGGYVAKAPVTVQDFDQNVSIAVDPAVR